MYASMSDVQNKRGTANIKIEVKRLSMYELSYLSVETSKLLFFCELLQEEQYDKIDKYFIKKSNYQLTRSSKEFKEYSRRVEVIDVKKGSIEYLLANAPNMISIVVGLIGIKLTLNSMKRRYEFHSDKNDDVVEDLLDSFENIDLFCESFFGYYSI